MAMDFSDTGKCTALVPVGAASIAVRSHAVAAKPDASFVAHLIAVATGTPQTRTLRRATQADAIDGYRFSAVRKISNSVVSGTRISRVA